VVRTTVAEPIIRVENLGKKYLIRHQEGGARYRALRDVLAGGLKTAAGLLRGNRPRRPRLEEFWALRGVSFEVSEGEAVGIIGRNGAGKSTLLKVLSRITEPSAGRVTLHGRVASLLEVGTGFHPELTGRENIYLNGSILGMRWKEIARQFDAIVDFAGVEQFLDTPVKRYSSGMSVRLAFAVAAHLEPEVLVIDEVLAVGDADFQRKCIGKMKEVATGGRTVLFVSHNMGAVQTLCTAAIRLDGGRVAAAGPAAEVVAGYLADTDPKGTAAGGPRVLGPDIELRELALRPQVIPSGGRTDVAITLRATAGTVIRGLCLLVYSNRDTRVAVIDLRSAAGPYRAAEGQTLTVTREVHRLPLVEGDYKLGLFVHSDCTGNDFFDLGALEVTPAVERPGVVPYPAQYRGFVEPDCGEPAATLS
jgi:lipopolysaccharide transport system ATP-binding protein